MDEKTKTAQTSSNASASMLNSKDDKSTKEIPAKDGRSENENIGGEKTGKDASIPPNKGDKHKEAFSTLVECLYK